MRAIRTSRLITRVTFSCATHGRAGVTDKLANNIEIVLKDFDEGRI
jgi:hypothetical protein